MTLISSPLTTEAEVERLMSVEMKVDFADHDEDGLADTGIVDDCINEASEEIELALNRRYASADLQSSNLIGRWATMLAATLLCRRRGNMPPESWDEEVQRIRERLEDVASGKKNLPGVSLRADLRPTFSNLRVDRRYRHSKVRVTQTNSSDAPSALDQDTSIEPPALLD